MNYIVVNIILKYLFKNYENFSSFEKITVFIKVKRKERDGEKEMMEGKKRKKENKVKNTDYSLEKGI